MEEIKTNDVRRIYVGDLVGVSAEIGRPGQVVMLGTITGW
jgi:hypothetical protein